MKKLHLVPALFAMYFCLVSKQMYPGNPPLGSTGAPNESTCERSGCHSGGTYTGNVTVTGVPDTVYASLTYPLTLTISSNAVRGGFQITSLDDSNAGSGSFVAGTGVNVAMSGGKRYARQSTPRAFSGGAVSWTFDWVAPSTIAGQNVTLYFAGLAANGNGNDNGDNVFTASKKLVFGGVSAAEEPSSKSWLEHEFKQNQLRITLNHTSKGALEAYSISGVQVLNEVLGADQIISTAHLNSGIYVVKVTAGGKAESFKIYVP